MLIVGLSEGWIADADELPTVSLHSSAQKPNNLFISEMLCEVNVAVVTGSKKACGDRLKTDPTWIVQSLPAMLPGYL